MKRFLAVLDWLMLLGAIVAGLTLLLALTGCGHKPIPRETLERYERERSEQPSTAENARQRLAQAEADVSYYRALSDQLAKAERQAQIERVCTWVRWLALLGLFGSVALHVIAWIQPSLRPLRALSGMGAAGAVAVLALAWVLPEWGTSLFWIAVTLTLGGIGFLVYRLVRTGRGLEGAARVAEGLKAHVVLSRDERRDLQARIAGKDRAALDEVLPAIIPKPRGS